jgi:hypothetical protein
MDFVRSRDDGPLFYGSCRRSRTAEPRRKGDRGRSSSREEASDRSAKRHASKGPANRLAAWIRDQGFRNKRKDPNHALRHWFKDACQRAGVQDSVADAIQGHSGNRGEADRYRHTRVAVMHEAIRRIPVPRVRAAQAAQDPTPTAAHEGRVDGPVATP